MSLPLFAQDDPPAILFFFIAGVCGFYLLLLIAAIFYLLTLSKALTLCHPRNRTMEPGMVWLNLIPFFGFVWIFLTQIRIAESLKEEFRDRGWHRRGEDYGQTMGIVSSALIAASHAMGYCGLPVLVGGGVCWILHWVKIANFNRQLASRSPVRYDRYEDDYDDEDYEDDRPRRRRRDDDDDDDDDYDRRPRQREDHDERDERDSRNDEHGDGKPWERPRG